MLGELVRRLTPSEAAAVVAVEEETEFTFPLREDLELEACRGEDMAARPTREVALVLALPRL